MPPFGPVRNIGLIRGFVAVGDFNNDGLVEPFYFINNGDGTFDNSPWDSIQAILQPYAGRIDRATAIFDLDGDENLDVVWNVYSSPDQEDSFALVLYGNGDGTFTRFEEYRDVNGFGETLVVADFNNDGRSDVFAPVYTHVPGAEGCYLLLGDGNGLGEDRAAEWGVTLTGLSLFFRVEGAQAADVDFDGRIDLFVASHLFMNEGQHFSQHTLDPFLFDEGAAFLDFDNDGDFDLVLRDDEGSPRLLRNDGGTFVDLGAMLNDVTGGDGLKVYDIDSNGWEDIVFGSSIGLTILFNQNGTFERIDLPDVPYSPTYAFFDADNDRRIDLVGQPNGSSPEGVQAFFLENDLPRGEAITLTLLGAGGELNQHGRSVRLSSLDDPTIRMARAVESGSGLLSQSQYTMLIGLPSSGLFNVEIAFASGIYSFLASKDLDVVAFADGRVVMTGGLGDDAMMGGLGADRLDGGDGNDRLYGSQGADAFEGGAGQDSIDFSRVAVGVSVNLGEGLVTLGPDLQAVAGIEDVGGSEGDDEIVGDAASNQFFGGGGNDLLDGGAGADMMYGGAGDDLYMVDDSGDIVGELASTGNDEVRTALATYSLSNNVERLVGLSDQGQQLTGNALGNCISGGAGPDTFHGLAGNDIYLVADGDSVAEDPGEGIDEIRTALAGYTLPDNVENLFGTGVTGQTLVGNGEANLIQGGTGGDTLEGGGGDDLYIVDAGDQVIELAGAGLDEVRTSLSTYVLADNAEILSGTSLLGQELTGNDLNNRISGGAGADIFRGGGGDDLYHVGTNDQVVEQAGDGVDEIITALSGYSLGENVENLTGIALSGQKLIGNSLDNVMTGGAGADTLIGGTGDDTYYVNNLLDYIYEFIGEGFDTVRTVGTYVLYHTVRIERLEAADPTGSAGISLVGNEFANRIVGNAGANVLLGGGGGDVLQGLGGDDIYGLDTIGDVVIEVDGEGFDQIATFFDYILTDALSIEVLYARDITLTTALALTGNASANALDGNAGANRLDGGGGADVLRGFGGDDSYVVDDAGDVVIEVAGEGEDRILTGISLALTDAMSIETLSALDAASTAALDLTGNASANALDGNAGANRLDGGGGADVLRGFGGDDSYVVDDAGDVVIEVAGEGEDRILTGISLALTDAMSIETLSALDAASTAALDLTGNASANALDGNAGANRLDGGGGADVLRGFGGDDSYVVDDAGDVVIEVAGEGEDRILTGISLALTDAMSIETLSALDAASTAALDLTGNASANALDGNAGANRLDGGGGADVLRGFGGDDSYVVDDAGDVVIEVAGEGEDRILTGISLALTDAMSIETLSALDAASTAALDLTGNASANALDGNAGANRLDGGGGADVLRGFGGDDSYVVDDAGDVVIEVAGEGEDRILTGISLALTDAMSIETLSALDAASTAALDLTGNASANALDGNAGANRLDGGGGADVLRGFGGDDSYVVDDAGDVVIEVAGEGEDRILTGISLALTDAMSIETLSALDAASTAALDLTGNASANALDGNAGANRLDGGGGADVLRGFGGDDSYVVDDAGDVVIEVAGEGEDRILTGISLALTDAMSIETLSALDAASTAALDLTGNASANALDGNAGANRLDGGGGADVLRGFGGDDSYVVDDAGDVVIEVAGEGEDRILTGISLALTDAMSIETLSALDAASTAALDLTGNASANALDGNAGANRLDGGGGADVLRGFGGDDSYVVDDAGDVVIEVAGEGEDRILTGISLALTDAMSIETLSALDAASTAALDLTGNASANALDGNAGANRLDGGGGADVLRGFGGDDSYVVDDAGDVVIEVAGEGEDRILTGISLALTDAMSIETLSALDAASTAALDLTGNASANALDGNAGANRLDGGGGADVLRGFGGDDSYVVDDAGDVVIEVAGEGEDRILTGISLALTDAMSIETLSALDAASTAALDLTGNASANALDGNAGANRLDGGGGADVLRGFGGDDSYVVDDAGDVVIEVAGEGEDRILTGISLALTDAMSIETLSALDAASTAALDLTGNASANALDGNAGANRLDGGGGADVLRGFGGDDSYVVDDAGDVVIEVAGEGEDRILTGISLALTDAMSIETLSALDAASTAALDLTGNASANALDGNAGANRLDGGGGADVLRGFGGDDSYVVDDAGDVVIEVAGEGEDRILTGISLALTDAMSIETLSALDAASTAALDLTGNASANALDGNAGANRLDGGGGADVLRGFGGDDSYVVDDAGDVVIEVAGEGEDRILTGISLALTDAMSIETLSALDAASTAALDLTGNASANALDGNAGANRLDGGGGADVLRGFGGDDSYVVDDAGDVVIEVAGEGEDRILTGISLALTDAMSIETLSALDAASTAALDLTGNASANALDGNAGANRLDGGGGADVLRGFGGDDSYVVDDAGDVVIEVAGEGEDRILTGISLALTDAMSIETLSALDAASTAALDLTGNASANALDGNAGANRLDGGGGADVLRGFGGDDSYVVDDAGDVVIEVAGEGEDRILTGISLALTDAMSIETLSALDAASTAALDLTGNASANALDGNAGANRLDGGGGADVLRGFGGDDSYVVDDAGDVVIEVAGEGEDRILTGISLALTDAMSIETLSALDAASTAALDLTGNASANALDGNAGANRLDGGGGADVLRGFGGDDSYVVDDAGDVVIEVAGEGEDRILTGISLALTDAMSIETLSALDAASTAALDLTGNASANALDGNAGANRLDGGGGADVLRGFGGDDSYVVDDAGDVVIEVAGEGEDRILTGISLALTDAMSIETLSALDAASTAALDLTGNASANALDGNAGANRLDGGGGADVLRGFGGDDSYVVDDAGDVVIEVAGEGEDRILTGISLALTDAMSIETLSALDAASTAALDLTGNASANALDGNAGANRLDGGGGADVLRGFGGDDSYVVDDAGDVVIEVAGEGEDRILTGISLALTDAMSIETLSALDAASTAALDLTGNASANALDGNAGANRLDGGGGADVLRGFGGDDSYVVDDAGDRVVEAGAEGTDTIFSSVNYTLAAASEIEALKADNLGGITALTLIGNEFAQTITGNAGNNTLIGEGGADTLIGGAGNDSYRVEEAGDLVIEAVGGGFDSVYTLVSYTLANNREVEALLAIDPNAATAMTLTGNEFDNFIFGNAGSNTLIGGAGSDTLLGGAGNDFYRVEDSGDKITESVGGGIDSVYAVGNYTLIAGAEVELLSAIDPNNTVAMTLIGNEFDNFIFGNAGSNTLIGGAGSDTLIGNGGDDFYRVEDSGDKISEAVGGGFDSAYAVGNYTLAGGAEVEVLSAIDPANAVAMTLIGNEFDNFIIGNNGVNTLIGGSGSDTLIGNGGDDFYRVEDSGDKITEGAGGGFDSAYAVGNYTLQAGAEVELLSAINPGNSVAMNLTGNSFANRLIGNNGANVLNGGGGSDMLTGFGGADLFAFTTALGAGNIDAIADFSTVDDTIQLDDAIFTAIGPLGPLGANAFVTGMQAGDADDRIIYNSATGALLYDADGAGAGAAVQFATLSTGLAMTAADFVVV